MAFLRTKLDRANDAPGRCAGGRPRAVQAGFALGRWIVLVLAAFLLGAGAPERAREYKMKAAYLYNFSKYVEWPETAFPAPDAPFVIGVLGPDPVGEHLRLIARHMGVGHRKLEVRRFAKVEEVEPCSILFITAEVATEDQQKVLAKLAGLPVLAVGESEKFPEWGGVIRFKLANDRINLVISKSAYEQAGLNVSSKLLQLDVVEIVK